MLKLIAQNKYKLMAFIIGLYLLLDVLQHKGQLRVLFPKHFADYPAKSASVKSKSTLINVNKSWKKGIDTREHMNALNPATPGFECDLYFDTAKNNFDIHHDADNSTGFSLEDILKIYQQKKMTASIWLDIKNLNEATAKPALFTLIQFRNKYNLQNKLLVESGRANLLTEFSDSGFYTSYYTPMFNPYLINEEATKQWADSISIVISTAKVNALSGYYFQYSFLHYYFPDYPILTWGDYKPFSLVNWLFRRKIERQNAIYISLYP